MDHGINSRPDGGVWLIVGAQAAGKSTVADLLARRVERGVHVRGAQFYRWVVTGWSHAHEGTPEARAHLDLRYRLGALVASEYAAAGFTAVLNDNVYGDDVVHLLRAIRARPRRLVVLNPRADVVAARDAARVASTGKVAYRDGYSVEGLVAALRATPRVGLWLDTSDQSPSETLDEVLARAADAVVDDAV
ncbi:MAG TPA: AAA family ATPase [Acidimicrobiales bacterium]|nr:AAA family ATPase [Acidimicrobiales bacterium]